jgi:hypothetical protein
MRVKPFTSFLAPLALVSLIAAERPAEAVLTYYIYEPAGTGNVVVETLVSLNLPSGVAIEGCSAAPVGVIFSSVAGICIGPSAQLNAYTLISGPFSFIGPDNLFADSASGIATTLVGVSQQFAIDTTYTGGPIISSSTFGMSTLTGLGFTTTGLLGTWTLDGTGRHHRGSGCRSPRTTHLCHSGSLAHPGRGGCLWLRAQAAQALLRTQAGLITSP